jgi:polyisoprenoid-binding protein YceI
VDGRSSTLEGKAVITPDGKVLAMVRIPIASFDSGDANRDANMRETLEAGRHPFVVFKGVTSLVVPVAHGKPLETTLRGELDFHGVKRPLEVPMRIEFAPDGSANVRGKMKVSLDAHAVERPSLLFIKVDDTLAVDLDLRLKKPGS